MANFLTFVKGTEYTLNIYNRIFAEHPCIITSSATGKSYTDIVTTGVVYYYVNTDGESYTGDINYDLDTGDIYTGSEYTINSKLLDIIKIVFTPSAAWTAPAYYIQSGKKFNNGKTNLYCRFPGRYFKYTTVLLSIRSWASSRNRKF